MTFARGILCSLSMLIVLFLQLSPLVSGATHCRLKFLFELEMGRKTDQFLLSFAAAPFAPVYDLKTPLCLVGTQVLVDNQGDFYLLKQRNHIVKMDSKGVIIKEIKGSRGFTVPIRMEFDRHDNLYVMFRNNTGVAEEFAYAVAKFEPNGEIAYWIGDEGQFNCMHMEVTINGTLLLRMCGSSGDELHRFDESGTFTGVVAHAKDSVVQMTDEEGRTCLHSIHHITAEGADRNTYVVSKHDLTVRKYAAAEGIVRQVDGVDPDAVRILFPWIPVGGKPEFQGFDSDNNMYFYFGHWKREQTSEFLIDVAMFSDTLLSCRYEFETDQYDTLVCDSPIEPRGKFMTRKILRNYTGELYEAVIFFNDAPNVSPEDHVRFYKWEPVE